MQIHTGAHTHNTHRYIPSNTHICTPMCHKYSHMYVTQGHLLTLIYLQTYTPRLTHSHTLIKHYIPLYYFLLRIQCPVLERISPCGSLFMLSLPISDPGFLLENKQCCLLPGSSSPPASGFLAAVRNHTVPGNCGTLSQPSPSPHFFSFSMVCPKYLGPRSQDSEQLSGLQEPAGG